jgi:hypothetical protein
MRKLASLALVSIILFAAGSCSKSAETLTSAPLSDYFPLTVGKYITYRLDSIVLTNTSKSLDTNTYQVRYTVDAQITDNLGRKAFRIIRAIRNEAGTSAWRNDATFMAIDDTSVAEFIDNNLRFVKLSLPIANGFSWKGNNHIDTYSSNSPYVYLLDWNYTYENVGEPYTVNGTRLDNTISIRQQDEVLNTAFYKETNIAREVYGKGIGMIYKQYLHLVYQIKEPASSSFYSDNSYGITLTMIDHN